MKLAHLALGALLVAPSGCDDAAGGAAPVPVGDECVIAVVGTDYASTAVSLLDADGALCADDVIDSGSAAVGVLTALSGDVVLPTSPSPTGELVLVDRYPNAVLTVVSFASGHAEVARQIPVGTGFDANPHDVLFLSPTRAYVSRYATNPTPTADPGDLDDGGDLLIVDPSTGDLLGRVDLRAEAGAIGGVAVDPRPDRLLALGGRIWVSLGNLSRRFDAAAEGALIGVDPATDTVVARLTLPGLANCGQVLAPAPDDSGFWLACVGLLEGGRPVPGDEARAGLAFVAVDGATGDARVAWQAGAAALFGGRIPGWGLVAERGDVAWITVFGDPDDGVPDSLLRVDRGDDGGASDVDVTTEPFALSALLRLPERGLLLVGDANRAAPALRRYAVGAPGAPDALDALTPTNTSPSVGLEPRHLLRFRR